MVIARLAEVREVVVTVDLLGARLRNLINSRVVFWSFLEKRLKYDLTGPETCVARGIARASWKGGTAREPAGKVSWPTAGHAYAFALQRLHIRWQWWCCDAGNWQVFDAFWRQVGKACSCLVPPRLEACCEPRGGCRGYFMDSAYSARGYKEGRMLTSRVAFSIRSRADSSTGVREMVTGRTMGCSWRIWSSTWCVSDRRQCIKPLCQVVSSPMVLATVPNGIVHLKCS